MARVARAEPAKRWDEAAAQDRHEARSQGVAGLSKNDVCVEFLDLVAWRVWHAPSPRSGRTRPLRRTGTWHAAVLLWGGHSCHVVYAWDRFVTCRHGIRVE